MFSYCVLHNTRFASLEEIIINFQQFCNHNVKHHPYWITVSQIMFLVLELIQKLLGLLLQLVILKAKLICLITIYRHAIDYIQKPVHQISLNELFWKKCNRTECNYVKSRWNCNCGLATDMLWKKITSLCGRWK